MLDPVAVPFSLPQTGAQSLIALDSCRESLALTEKPMYGHAGAQFAADVLRGEPGRAAGLARLRRASEFLLAPVHAVVRDDADPVDAILDEARARDAHLVVIGQRPGRRRDRFGVAARVVDFVQRSVLVIPIPYEVEP